LPVTFINWRIGGDPVLIASQGGLNFFLGNNDEANGWSATAPSLFRVDWWGGYEDAISIAEDACGRELKGSEVSDYWFEQGLAWWGEHPGRGIAITARKAVFLLSGVEFGNNRDPGHFFGEFVPTARPFLYYLYWMTPLALLGAAVLVRRGDPGGWTVLLYLAVYSLSVILFFVTARYRVPLRPLLAILAVVGGATLLDAFRRHPVRGLALAGTMLAFAVAVNANPWIRAYDPTPAQFYQSVASVYRSQGDLGEALAWQKRNVAEDPTYPEGNLNLGTLYMEVGNLPAAIKAFEAERAIDPGDAKNLASLAQALQRVGRTAEAEGMYARAEALGLEDAPALYNHALCVERLERSPAEAEALYRRAVIADPEFADAWNNLGVLLARDGRLEDAVPMWEKAVRFRPDFTRAHENLERARQQLAGPEPGE
jgi:Flp pilus assembly protein TadD